MATRTSLHGQWSSRMAFVFAVSGSAIGLGNLWKFPYITGQNGGGAFVLLYLICVFSIGLPIMMSEVLLGRRGRRNPIDTMALLGEEEAGRRGWKVVGALGVLAAFLILSFYSVIAGWGLAYIFKTASGTFVGADHRLVSSVYEGLTANWLVLLGWHTVFMLMTAVVVARGVQRGLERAVQILMPSLVILLLVLVGYAMRTGDMGESLRFLFRPDFASLNRTSVMIALGHAFFTLSLGMGAVMAYGAYLPQQASIGGTTLVVVIADTLVALLASLVIFPIVFANGLDPAEGPGLIFETLPLAFGQMKGGAIFGMLFFVLLTFAAWTSSIGLLEPAVAWLSETRGMQRNTATAAIAGAVWALGLVTVFSFNLLSGVSFWRGSLYSNLDHLASNIMLPVCGLLMTLFAGWVMCANSSSQELGLGTGPLYQGWRFLTRFVAPVGVLLVLVSGAGLFAGG